MTQSPDKVNDIGYFAVTRHGCLEDWRDDLDAQRGTYIPKTSKHIAEAMDFLAFIASTAGTDALAAAVPPSGPYMIKGTTLPDTVLPLVKDLAAYIGSENNAPALEYLSPIKGPSLEQICVAAGTGQMDAATAAAAYDKDVEKQAQQLGLPGW